VKIVRFNRLLASTALGLVLMLGSHAGMAQQPERPIDAGVPAPDTSLLPPPTVKDLAATPSQAPAATAPAPVATAAAVDDSAVTDKLRELITGKQFDRTVSRKADRESVDSFYKARNYAPLWLSAGAANDRAKSAIAYLAQADAVGLDPNDYPAPDFKAATTADALAEAELKLTAAALTFARQAQIGRIHFSRVGADIQFDLNAPDPASVLAKLADACDAGKALYGYNQTQA
jgi:murein L,D-transpeptidase YcbB/YkuD